MNGQFALKGSALFFAQDVEEIPEQLPISLKNSGCVYVCQTLEGTFSFNL